VISFLEVIKGGKEQSKKVNVRWPKSADLHPNLKYVLVPFTFLASLSSGTRFLSNADMLLLYM
jgi:hypothetical protein